MNDRFRCLHGESRKIIRVFGSTQYFVQCLITKDAFDFQPRICLLCYADFFENFVFVISTAGFIPSDECLTNPKHGSIIQVLCEHGIPVINLIQVRII